jgi:GrpB-like predicted nucleotidyltransferase (UPF0157 family)
VEIDEPVVLVAYDPAWPLVAADLLQEIAHELQAWSPPVEHIGSTAVLGLVSKPIIDIMAGLSPHSEAAVEHMAESGWIDMGFDATGQRRYLIRRDRVPEANLHFIAAGSDKWRDDLLLRQWLKANPDAREKYALAKRHALATQPRLLGYSEAKRDTIQVLIEGAHHAAGSVRSLTP